MQTVQCSFSIKVTEGLLLTAPALKKSSLVTSAETATCKSSTTDYVKNIFANTLIESIPPNNSLGITTSSSSQAVKYLLASRSNSPSTCANHWTNGCGACPAFSALFRYLSISTPFSPKYCKQTNMFTKVSESFCPPKSVVCLLQISFRGLALHFPPTILAMASAVQISRYCSDRLAKNVNCACFIKFQFNAFRAKSSRSILI